MSIINKLSNFLINNRADSNEIEGVQSVLLLNYTLAIIAFLNLTFSIIHFFYFERPISYVLFGYFIAFVILFFIFRKNEKYKICSVISLILITSLYLLIAYVGAGNKTGIIWGLTYPVAVSIAFGFKRGSLFSLIFLGVTFIIFFVPSNLWADYSIDLEMRYTGAYLVILFITQYYLRLQQQDKNDNEKRLIETQMKLHEKDKLLSKLSYQIRTPLNNIAGITNLNHDVLDKNTIEEIEFSISNLITIVNSISNYSDNKALQIKGKKSLFNINSTIKKTVSLFQSDKYTELKCSLNLSDKIPEYVYGDRLILIQIILAVIDFYYNNKSSGNLKIELVSIEKETDNSVSVKIISNTNFTFLKKHINEKSVVNIDELNNNDVFIIQELTSSIKSSFEISYIENRTSFIFNFNFPDRETHIDNNDSVKSFLKQIKKKKIELKDAVILLVEDDAINSKIMTLNLNKFVGKIILAEDGKEALEKFGSSKVDLILMDVRMPLMDGYKTTEKIRKAETGAGNKIPIIAVTANASAETKKRCLDVGMDDYTTKPVNFKLLLKKMETLLS